MSEFFDENHIIAKKYYKLMDSYKGKNIDSIISKLKKLILKDPDYFEPYNSLQDLLQDSGRLNESNELVKQAFERALKRIVDEKGDWPDRLEWIFIGNRNIIRALLNQALLYWREEKTESALKLFRKLLQSNPNDNLGVRYCILAIRQKMNFSEFEDRFNKKGFYDNEINQWFYNNYLLFTDEFEWWEKDIENEDDSDEEFDPEEFLGNSGT